MKRLLILSLASLLSLASITGCRTVRPPSAPASDPTYTATTTTDRKGNTVANTVDNRGKAAAAEGQAMLTTEQVWQKLAAKLPASESPQFGWTMTETAYSIQDAPNQVIIDQLREKHKNLVAEISRLGQAGMKKEYDEAVAAAASIVEEIANRMKGGNDGPDGNDRGSIINRTISVGPDHTLVPLEQAKQFGASVQSRHGNQNTISKTNTVEREDTSTTEEIKAALESRNIIAAQQARLEELRLLREQSKREGRIVEEVITDKPDDTTTGNDADTPTNTTPYDQLSKKNYLYKTRLAANNPVTRHDSAFLIPKDRPQPAKLYIPGQTVVENYFSTSEDRWILRLKGALPNTPASAVATYKDGNTETFPITSLAGRTDKPAGPYKPAVPSVPDVPAVPPTTQPEVPAGQGEPVAP